MSGSRVLVVNVERPVVRGLEIMLRTGGHAVEVARSWSDVLARAIADTPDVLILDLARSDGHGVALCSDVRRVSALPILVLSAVGEEPETVRALEAGADDFLTTPFSIDDLLARLRAVVRLRCGSAASELLQLGELTVDVVARRVTLAGAEVELERFEFALVRELARHQGRLVRDCQLLDALWGRGSGRETSELRLLVAGVRRKLEREPSSPRYLITEAGVGYRLDHHRRERMGTLR
jgi:two-component system, OmpR family, KDP operon response regulator KdpE